MTTKERILEESIKLFSVNGYDAVSIRCIADAVGIGNSALYKHYPSKFSILEVIVEKSKQHFWKKCNQVQASVSTDMSSFVTMCLTIFEFQIEDEWIVMFRKLLLIEQFKNEKMSRIFKEFFIDYPINSQKLIFDKLIKNNVILKKDPEVLAVELYAPFFMYHTIECDRVKLLELLSKHAEYFYIDNIQMQNP